MIQIRCKNEKIHIFSDSTSEDQGIQAVCSGYSTCSSCREGTLYFRQLTVTNPYFFANLYISHISAEYKN